MPLRLVPSDPTVPEEGVEVEVEVEVGMSWYDQLTPSQPVHLLPFLPFRIPRVPVVGQRHLSHPPLRYVHPAAAAVAKHHLLSHIQVIGMQVVVGTVNDRAWRWKSDESERLRRDGVPCWRRNWLEPSNIETGMKM